MKKQFFIYDIMLEKSSGNIAKVVEEKQPSLRRLHTQFCNANNPMSETLDAIQAKLHQILNLNFPQESKSEEMPFENQDGAIAYELEYQMRLAHQNTQKAEKILRHINQIV